MGGKMEPLTVVLWICVAVFAATSVVAILFLIGRINGPYEKLLIGTLITQVVVISVSAYGSYFKTPEEANKIPIKELMVIEQSTTQVLRDDDRNLYLRSPDVSRAKRIAELAVDVREDFTSQARFTLETGKLKVVNIGGRNYRFAFSKMGQVDADPNETHAPTLDFIFLAIERAKSQ